MPAGPTVDLTSWVGRHVGELIRWIASSRLRRALRLRKYARVARRSGLFDVEHYLLQCGHDPAARRDPIRHYLQRGEAAGFSPNPWFDAAWYLRSHSGVAETCAGDKSPFVHYIRLGAKWQLRPGPDFDALYYASAYPDVASSGLTPLAHYLTIGRREGRARLPPSGTSPRAAPPLFFGASAAVPFAYPVRSPSPAPRLAVALHLFHADLAAEFHAYLANIPFPYDLYVTTDARERCAALKRLFLDGAKGNVEVRVAENRGRDIAPKLVAFRDVYERYDYFLHLHTKKSSHLSALAPWRTYLLETLIGSPDIVRSIFAIFGDHPGVGLVAAQHFEPIRHCIGWGENRARAGVFADRMGIRLEDCAEIDFPSGSMFWGRTAALRPLLDLELTASDFDPEQGQIDGTLAHVIERLYLLVCERAGYGWMKIARPHLLPTTAAIAEIGSAEALRQFVAEKTSRLLERALAGSQAPLPGVVGDAATSPRDVERRSDPLPAGRPHG